jgi:hypothetical protein
MKRIILISLALIGLSSCCKERDYLCTVEQTHPEGIVYHTSVVIPFRGTYGQMKAYEAARTFGTPGSGAWQTCTCK